MTTHLEYQAAVQRAEAKKASFLANTQLARARVSPSRLKDDAKSSAQKAWHDGNEKAQDTARQHPVAVGAAGVGLIAYLFRRPLYRLVKRGFARLNRPAEPESTATQASLWLKQKLHSAASAARLNGESHEK
ncbi:MAG: hypothetical protein QHC67_09295 [Sphingobium sp.]|uniref:hypothetical protein n=1 Tax=Sphingobium sp. TaxID=1912891 RepID=UPI0029B08520|nr:hypothetical protein [Sphingobium sp.]MDX3910002.1 hypothetical protein [Sphingobium sp.]